MSSTLLFLPAAALAVHTHPHVAHIAGCSGATNSKPHHVFVQILEPKFCFHWISVFQEVLGDFSDA
jgi:hypothetical protein